MKLRSNKFSPSIELDFSAGHAPIKKQVANLGVQKGVSEHWQLLLDSIKLLRASDVLTRGEYKKALQSLTNKIAWRIHLIPQLKRGPRRSRNNPT